MKHFFLGLLFSSVVFVSQAQEQPKPTTPIQTVEASCGQCKFGLKGNGCDLAVRINGKAYFMDGSSIESHGDSHGKDGFCNAIRKAEVTGEVVNNRFKATSFKLLPPDNTNKKKDKTQ